MTKVIAGNSQAAIIATYKKAQAANPLREVSPNEASAWILANVTDLASARQVVAKMAEILALHDKIISVLAKQVRYLKAD